MHQVGQYAFSVLVTGLTDFLPAPCDARIVRCVRRGQCKGKGRQAEWVPHLHIACPQAPLQLAGGDGVHCVRSPDLLSGRLRDAKVLYLAHLHHLLQSVSASGALPQKATACGQAEI